MAHPSACRWDRLTAAVGTPAMWTWTRFALLTGVLVVVGCSRETARPPAAPAPRTPATGAKSDPTSVGRVVMHGTTLTGSDANGERLWQAKARQLEFDEKAERAELQDAACTFLAGGRRMSRVRAGRLTVYLAEGNRRLVFSGKVHAVSFVTAATADFEHVTYLWDQKRLVNGSPVRLTKGNTCLTGTLLEGDVALRRVRVVGSPARMTAP